MALKLKGTGKLLLICKVNKGEARGIKLDYAMDSIYNFVLTGGSKCHGSHGWLLKVNQQFIM